MAFAFIGNANANATGATSLTCNRPAGVAVGNLIVAVYAFEGVAPGSGPWIVPNIGQLSTHFIGPSQGWDQACWQTPSAAGVGIEVWVAIHGSGTDQSAQFAVAQNAVTVTGAWSGEYNPSGIITSGIIRLAPTGQVTGNQPAAPSVLANGGELIVACGGDLMGGGGFGTPSGFTNRVDATRAGAGTVEATLADATVPSAGATGPITFPNAAAAGTTRGATATLAVVPAPVAAGTGAVLDAPMPEDMDLPDGYVMTWAAIDPNTGGDIAGVVVSNVSLFGTDLGTGGGGDGGLVGPFMLVPGPGA
jgi:hypothetical protein